MESRAGLLTPEACRAARGLLGWNQYALAERAGVSRVTVADFERGARRPLAANLVALRSALEAGGADFLAGGAVLRTGRAALPVSDVRLAEILRRLQADVPRLRRLGVARLSIFGSTARGTASVDSDVDLLLELDPRRKLDLLDYAGIVAEIQKLLAQKIDVAQRSKLKPHVAQAALQDELVVFQ
jgi:predicted nucleotidyltransferase/DNA-binding XRE family transcriptional regulator